MALEVRLTPLARRDLAGIHDWTIGKFGLQQADRYVADLAAVFLLVAESPGIAREADEVRRESFSNVVPGHMSSFSGFQKRHLQSSASCMAAWISAAGSERNWRLITT